MIRRLFVDCDGTLVLWDDEHVLGTYGVYDGERFMYNTELIERVHQFVHHHPNVMLVVWSGGGKDYARMWGERCFPHLFFVSMIKDKTTFELVGQDDIVIDDIKLGGVVGKQFLPFQDFTGEVVNGV